MTLSDERHIFLLKRTCDEIMQSFPMNYVMSQFLCPGMSCAGVGCLSRRAAVICKCQSEEAGHFHESLRAKSQLRRLEPISPSQNLFSSCSTILEIKKCCSKMGQKSPFSFGLFPKDGKRFN